MRKGAQKQFRCKTQSFSFSCCCRFCVHDRPACCQPLKQTECLPSVFGHVRILQIPASKSFNVSLWVKNFFRWESSTAQAVLIPTHSWLPARLSFITSLTGSGSSLWFTIFYNECTGGGHLHTCTCTVGVWPDRRGHPIPDKTETPT